jgi:hypothetical protein
MWVSSLFVSCCDEYREAHKNKKKSVILQATLTGIPFFHGVSVVEVKDLPLNGGVGMYFFNEMCCLHVLLCSIRRRYSAFKEAYFHD